MLPFELKSLAQNEGLQKLVNPQQNYTDTYRDRISRSHRLILNPPAMFCVICVIIHSDRKLAGLSFMVQKAEHRVLDTPICRASSEHDVPFLRFFISSFLFSASILILGVYPFFALNVSFLLPAGQRFFSPHRNQVTFNLSH